MQLYIQVSVPADLSFQFFSAASLRREYVIYIQMIAVYVFCIRHLILVLEIAKVRDCKEIGETKNIT